MGFIIAQFNLVETVEPPFRNVEALEQREIGEIEMRVRRDHLLPLAGRVDARLHQPEIGMGVVGADIERALMLIDIIFAPFLARRNKARRGEGIVGGDEPCLARHMVAGADDDPFLRRGKPDGDAETLIILMEYLAILLYRRAQHMHPRIVRPPILIGEAVEQRLAVARPHQRGQGAGDHIAQHVAGRKIADAHLKPLAAVGIDREGEITAAGGNRHRAETEIFMPLGQRGLIEDQLVLNIAIPARDRLAIPFAILRADLERAPIDIVAILLRDGLVILLDAALHLLEQRVDHALMRLHRLLEPAILLLQIGQHRLVLHIGIAGIAQPGIGIVQHAAMMLDPVLAAVGDGRRRKQRGIGHSLSLFSM